MIIVEGADNTGKSTIAHHLADTFGLTYLHSRGPSLDLFDQLLDTMTGDPDFTFQKTVFDRFFFSELVYGPLLRGKICFTPQQIELIWHLLLTCEPIVIFASRVRVGFENRTHSIDQARNDAANLGFNELMKASPLWDRTVFYDATKQKPDKFDNVVRNHLATRQVWINWRRFTSHGRGPRFSSTVLVGENFAKNSSKRTPFERSKSALLLHEAINSIRLPGINPWKRLYITNADKTGAGLSMNNLLVLKSEFAAFDHPLKYVALGSQASAALEKIKVKHTRVNHPAYFVRIGEEKRFVEAFRKALGVTSISET